ncbi:MAG: DUF1460 domain-containing protein, partial [Burkholderiales bacterium]|nr:DUF1460 domain-containing protein [Burkholderiales bacterium]
TPNILNKIKQLDIKQQIAKKPTDEIVTWVGTQLLNSPYSFYLLDQKTPEYLYISLSKTDCMLFVEEVIVLSRLIKTQQLNLGNYIAGIKQIRYHGNVSYCNRNHYVKDWLVMNESQNILQDIGISLSNQNLPNKASILSEVIAKNKNNIHHSNLQCIQEREQIVNQETIGFIPIAKLANYLQYIKSGDIIGIVAKNPTKSDAIRHLGIAYIKDGRIGYLNASSKKNNVKVVIYNNLMDYLHANNDAGIVLVRIKN